VWFLLQSAIILAVVQSNISWHWADHGIQVGIVGVGLAYLATIIVGGWGRPQIRGEKIVLKMTTKVVVSTAAVIVAAGLCWQGARAQAQIDRLNALRPPAEIPNVIKPKVTALMPPTAPLLRSAPTPIPPAEPVVLKPLEIPIPTPRPTPIPVTVPIPSHIALPPAEYDHPYSGKLVVLKEDNLALIRHVCRDTPNPVACSYRTYDSATGETLSCLIMLGPGAHENAVALRHEIGHCNGWPGDHPGAHYD
jgi:hypothetical protein